MKLVRNFLMILFLFGIVGSFFHHHGESHFESGKAHSSCCSHSPVGEEGEVQDQLPICCHLPFAALVQTELPSHYFFKLDFLAIQTLQVLAPDEPALSMDKPPLI